jgi:hypothetical protein
MAACQVSGQAVRLISVVQGAAGIGLSARPHSATAAVGIRDPHAPPAWLVRVLGTRMAVQAGVQLCRPTPEVAWIGSAVDAAHALSMIGVAALSRRYRRGALMSAAIAGLSSLSVAVAAGTDA